MTEKKQGRKPLSQRNLGCLLNLIWGVIILAVVALALVLIYEALHTFHFLP